MLIMGSTRSAEAYNKVKHFLNCYRINSNNKGFFNGIDVNIVEYTTSHI